jgi:argininosuccinate lyase
VKMWSGRFRQPLDPEFGLWQRSFPFDQRLLPHELAASAAHARALHAAGILSRAELDALLCGLEKIGELATTSGDFLKDEQAEDVHHFVERQLAILIGDTAYKLHSGRSRNEQVATDLRLYVRSSIDELLAQLGGFMDTLTTRAEKSGSAAMPAYTHTQRAEPVLVAHWLLAYVEMFMRDADRLQGCRKRGNVCPLGSGAVAGATLPLDRNTMAAELQFDGPTGNSIDATSDRDFILEFVGVLSLLSLHLSRWAEEMILFSTQEYEFIHLPESYSTGSSAMPQKKNADLLELVRGKAGRIIGHANTLLVCTKGLPLAYNKDLQETQEPVFDAVETMRSILPLVSGWMREAQFASDRMREAAQSGFMNAFTVATYLVERGIPSRLAHEQVGHAVQLCLEKGCELQDLDLATLRTFSPAFEEDVYAHLTLESVLAIHDVVGGTAPSRVGQAIAAVRQKITAMRGEVHAHA